MRACLVDTGPLVAYLDASDPEHAAVSSWLDTFTGQLLTTSAVITEAMHLVAASREGPELLAEFVNLTAMRVHDCTQPAQLPGAVALMREYADTPMDFADASLVLLGRRTGVRSILTLDRRGFSSYRAGKGKAFHRVLDVPRGPRPHRR
jgi:predicted nucleic acid-binding protein